ncbi:MAG TPA: hypothetical protein VGJ16_11750 [Pirellulales bacterium]|jgi:hypothetical protein
MDMILPVVLGLMILASFVIAYMSARTWPIYQVVLVAFIFLGVVGFFYLGARTLATHRAWGELVRRLEQETQTAEQQTVELRGGQNAQGQSPMGSIPTLTRELEILVASRGGMLTDVTVDSVENGTASLTLKSAEHGLAPNDVLFVFDQLALAEGGRYLGEFKVTKAEGDAGAIQIAPNLPLTDPQAKRLAESKGPWTLYTLMPVDDPAAFADLDENTRQPLVPKEAAVEFANRERKLRDYELFFHENYVQRSLIQDAIDKTKSNIERMEADAKETVREGGYRQAEAEKLRADLERFQFELRTIAAYQKSLESTLAKTRQSLAAAFTASRKLAADLAGAQFRSAERINAQAAAAPSATP